MMPLNHLSPEAFSCLNDYMPFEQGVFLKTFSTVVWECSAVFETSPWHFQMWSSSAHEEEVLIWLLCFHGLNAKWTGKALRFHTQKAEQRLKHGALWDTASLRSVTTFQLGLSAKESQLLYPVWLITDHSRMCTKNLRMLSSYLFHFISWVCSNYLICRRLLLMEDHFARLNEMKFENPTCFFWGNLYNGFRVKLVLYITKELLNVFGEENLMQAMSI